MAHGENGAYQLLPSPRWVRVVFNGVTVADSRRVALLREPGRTPVYYFPREDVRTDVLTPAGARDDAVKGRASLFTVQVGDRVAEGGAWTHDSPPPGAPSLAGHVALAWNDMDAWYEEDDEVYVHARDPYHRVDVLHSSRHVQVVVLGETVADTRRPRLLFETGLPTRYYLPRMDVRMDRLVPSSTTSQCPYKGRASYLSVRVGDRLVRDLVWTYPFPVLDCARIENLVCFFDEQVDAVIVDGEAQPRPRSPWSGPPVIVDVGEGTSA